MRKFLLLFCCSILSLTASAQWWKLKFKKPEPRQQEPMELLPRPKINSGLSDLRIRRPFLLRSTIPMNDRQLEAAQASTMKAAQRNMRYRVYGEASRNFSELAQLYVKQSRYSEAKWYFLQSTNLARKQNDHKLALANLIRLAMVKYEIGDFALANQDLLEARDTAASKGWLIDLIEIEKKLSYISHSRYAAMRDKRYAEGVTADMALQN